MYSDVFNNSREDKIEKSDPSFFASGKRCREMEIIVTTRILPKM